MPALRLSESARNASTELLDLPALANAKSRFGRDCLLGLLLTATASAAIAQASDPGQKAMELERDGHTAEAEAAWKALARQYPGNPEPLAHLGFLEAKQEHYTEAIADYRKAFAIAPQLPGLRLNFGLAYFKTGDYHNAITMFLPLYKAEPSDQRLNILLGMSHYGLGEFAASAPYLKQASEGDAQNLTLLLTLAHACLLSNQYPCVLDAYHKLVALNAESAEADMLVGEALDEMKDREGAIREFRAAVAADAKEPNVHFGLGYLLWKDAQYPEAADQFRAELVNDPGHALASLYLANSLVQMGKTAEAQPLLESFVKRDPRNAMARLNLGMVYADQDLKPEAVKEFEAAAQLDPSDVNAHWRLARLYRSMGRTADAKAEFDKAGSLNKQADDKLLKIMSTLPQKKAAAPAHP